MVIGIDGGAAAAEVGTNRDCFVGDYEAPRLRVVAVGAKCPRAYYFPHAAGRIEWPPGHFDSLVVSSRALGFCECSPKRIIHGCNRHVLNFSRSAAISILFFSLSA